jgi:hypothetical protein
MLSGVLALAFWWLFASDEYSGGIYADTHYTTSSIFNTKDLVLFICALLFSVLAIWFYKRSPQTKPK